MAKPPATKTDVDTFLARAQTAKPPATRASHRVMFAMDATASREPTWDMACSLHAELFEAAQDAGNMAVQLVYYRGIDQFVASPWSTTPAALLELMSGVRCLGGRTQLVRVIEHARRSVHTRPSHASVRWVPAAGITTNPTANSWFRLLAT